MDVEGSLWNHEAYVSEWFSKVSVIIKVRLGLVRLGLQVCQSNFRLRLTKQACALGYFVISLR